MFRIQKNDETVEHHDPKDETVDMGPPPNGSSGSVTSSALRWFRGKPVPSESGKAPRRRMIDSEFPATMDASEASDPAALDDRSDDLDSADALHLSDKHAADELELNNPIGMDAAPSANPANAVNSGRIIENRSAIGTAPPTTPAAFSMTPQENCLSMFEFDDDDDIDDFDDLGDLSDIQLFEPVTKPSMPRDTRRDDAARSGDRAPAAKPAPAAPPELPPELDDVSVQPQPVSQDTVEPAPSSGTTATGAPIDKTSLAPVLPPPPDEADDFPKVLLRKPALEQHVPSGDESKPKETTDQNSLSLRPIPELQSELRSSGKGVRLKDARIEGDAAKITTKAGSDALAEELKPAPATDWHTDLADALGGGIEKEDAHQVAAPSNAKEISSPQTVEAPTVTGRDGGSSPVLPLSTTLASLTNDDGPDSDQDDDPVPPSLYKDKRPAAEVRELASAKMPADRTEAVSEFLSSEVLANLPRLRRFAAVLISDAAAADDLVQTTIAAVLDEPSALETAQDLGHALLMLLYRERQQRVNGAGVSIPTAEAMQAFEATLCQRLAGADQFEIHQFVRAMNQIDEQDRALLILSALESLSYDQIAGVTQLPPDQVVLRLADARLNLRQILAADGADEDLVIVEEHPREIEIHGYLDGEFDVGHMTEMDRLVEHDHAAADRLMHYGIQGDLIRRIYAPLLNRPIPRDMLEAFLSKSKPMIMKRRRFGGGARRALFAGVFAVVLGAAGTAAWFEMIPSLTNLVSKPIAIVVSSVTAEQPEDAPRGPASPL